MTTSPQTEDIELGEYKQTTNIEDNVSGEYKQTTNIEDNVSEASSQEEPPPPTPSMSKLLSMSKPEWMSLFVALLLMAGAEVTGLYAPIVLSDCYNIIVDPTISSETVKSTISSKMLIVFILHWGGIAGGAIRGIIIAIAGERVVARLRNSLYAHLLSMEMGFFDKKKSGDLVSRLGNDTALIQTATTSSFPEVLIGAIKIVGTLSLMLFISVKLSIVMFIVFAVLLLLCIPFATFIGRISRQYQDSLAVASTFSTEALGSMRTVRSFFAEKKEVERYQTHIGNPEAHRYWYPFNSPQSTYKTGSIKGLVAPSFGAFAFGMAISAMYATLWVGFYDVVDGKLTLGRMVAFQSYVFQMGISLATLSGHFIALMTAKGAAARVFELLDRESEIQLDAGKTPEGKMKGDIVFENVEFRYPTRLETAVLKGFNLTVKENETVAIVGSSGAGKSTIIGLLQRFYDVSGGAVKFDGIDARDLHQGWIRRNLGLVGQEPTLFGLSIRDNLTYGIEDPSKITDEQVVEACKQANCHNFITQFPEGYKTMIGERGVRLSGGQKQRIAIARALIPSPSVLLLDEATSALDAESEHLVQTAIDEVMVGRTVVVIAHRLSTVRKADKIVVMDQGKVEAEGTHDELMKGCQIYKDLVSRQLSAK
ncbi:hypothetical protein TrCOL_g10984 [Triparma columacea]|uniref:ABC transporter n=1 Tax=Triparma columacea TaxID=722753 RepID=A0A9W7G7E1_9STRA|nr:hypothetical protein TrCOL_g10984 [Triparma columacea]